MDCDEKYFNALSSVEFIIIYNFISSNAVFFYIKKNASQYHWLKDYILDYILVYNRTDRSQVILKFELLIKKKQILIIKFINETYE